MIWRIGHDRVQRRVLTAAVLGVVLALHVWSLTRFPGPFVDEAWFGNRAWSLVQHGNPLGTLDHGVVDRFDGSSHFFQTLPMLVQAAALRLAGSPSLLALRAVSLIMGAVLALAIWLIARTWYDASTAASSVVLLGLSGPFTYSSHLARYDIIAAAFGYSAIALYVRPGRHRPLTAILAGLLGGIAFECHPFALAIVVALPVLAFEEFGWRVLSASVPRALIAGLVAGFLIYPTLHVLPNPQSYFELTRLIYGPTHTPSVGQLGTGLAEWLSLAVASFGFLTPVLIWALLTLSEGGDRRDRRLLLVSATISVAFAILVRNKQPYYSVLFTPPLVLCLAVAAGNMIRDRNRSPRFLRRSSLAAAAVLLTLSFGASFSAMRQDGRPAYNDALKRLAEVVEPGDSMMGSQTYWFGFAEHPYYSWEQLVYLRRLRPGLSIGDALTTMRPDLFIRDDHMEWFILDRPGDTAYTQLLWIPKVEIESWLAAHASIIADFVNPLYGRIRVYRIRWPIDGDSTRLR